MDRPPAIGVGKVKFFNDQERARSWFEENEGKISVISTSVSCHAVPGQFDLISIVYEEREWMATQERVFDPRER